MQTNMRTIFGKKETVFLHWQIKEELRLLRRKFLCQYLKMTKADIESIFAAEEYAGTL